MFQPTPTSPGVYCLQCEWGIIACSVFKRVLSFTGLKLFELEHKVLLTGTPLQNNVEELYSLLHFLEPKQFSSSEAFMMDFGNLKSETQVDKLKAVSIIVNT